MTRARLQSSGQLELVDDREPGLRLRAGERGAVWSILVRLRSGKRTRITLGPYPGLGISEARRLAQDKKRDIADGVDPNAKRRADVNEAAKIVASQRSLRDVLDQYEKLKLTQLRAGGNVRRALDGQRGLLRAFINRDIATITRGDVVNAVRTHATKSPMAANRGLAYIKAFMNWCVDQEILDANPAATVKKPSKERTRDRYHSMAELVEIWNAMGDLGYPFGPLYRLLVALPMRREEVAAISEHEFDLLKETPDDAVWTLPAARTKRGNALRVPLSPLARRPADAPRGSSGNIGT